MYDLIPPYGALYDVLPGDPWQPESAARYNAVNELLRQEHTPPPSPVFPGGSEQILNVLNVSEKEILINSPVQLDTSFAPVEEDYRISQRNFFACGKPVENLSSIWGVALENIRPGQSGTVQMSGIALLEQPKGFLERTIKERIVRNNYIFAGLDGNYHFGQRGRAEVIWFEPYSNCVLVQLGSEKGYQYTGMFAVLENGDGTFTVKGGETDLIETYYEGQHYTGNASINDTVIPVEGKYNEGKNVLLLAKLAGPQWQLEVKLAGSDIADYYIPGEQIYWELARYSGVDEYGYVFDFQQLHQGGVINFRERYYTT